MNILKNKIAVITGGNSAIGFATAQRFMIQQMKTFLSSKIPFGR